MRLRRRRASRMSALGRFRAFVTVSVFPSLDDAGSFKPILDIYTADAAMSLPRSGSPSLPTVAPIAKSARISRAISESRYWSDSQFQDSGAWFRCRPTPRLTLMPGAPSSTALAADGTASTALAAQQILSKSFY